MLREDIQKELLKKLTEVDELKKKLAAEDGTPKVVHKKKKSKLPLILGSVLALTVLIAFLPESEPLTPEELAAKKARVEAIKVEANEKTQLAFLASMKTSLQTAIDTQNHRSVLEKYESLKAADEKAAVSFQTAYENSKNKIEEVERQRKLNDLGNFYIGNYVDEFGDNTGKKFIGYKGSGQFSNSATEGSKLSFWIAIDSITEFDVSLYEYAGKNPVKDIFGGDAFVMRFRYADVTGQVTCKNSSDRISCGPTNSSRLVDAFKQASKVKFSIYNQRTTSSQYSFTVNANGFSNALRKLNE